MEHKNEVANWFGDLKTYPTVVVDAYSLNDLEKIVADTQQYPSPLKPVGQNHSTAQCCEANGGTIIRIKMNKILHIGEDTITVEPGVLYKDIELALDPLGKQLHINTEIGCLTAGSAAVAATKDSSFPNEYGQVGSYICEISILKANGEKVLITEKDQDLIRAWRSSYGNLGLVYQVCFKTKPKQPLKVWHKNYSLQKFIAQLPEIKQANAAIMYYLYPFENKITVEYRQYNHQQDLKNDPKYNTSLWKIRNHLWKKTEPYLGQWVERFVPFKWLRYKIVDVFNSIVRIGITQFLKSDITQAMDQTIRYPDVADIHRYTFSLWAFPEERYPEIVSAYFKFCHDYYKKTGYRTNLLNVGYRISFDQQSLFSYSWNGNVMTVDPVSTGNKGWREFLVHYNEFCSNLGGTPMFNQTWGVTRIQAEKAFGERLDVFKKIRQEFDPQNRFLNNYFKGIFC
ncbi:MAG: FAD-binding protein [Sediminibacterium sp.]|nr:FAD-binding protein [Sediminibacterium sp.]